MSDPLELRLRSIWHRFWRQHWPDYIYLETDVRDKVLYSFECMRCDRNPLSRGRFIPVGLGLR